MPEMTRRRRRNTAYDKEVGDDICDLIVDGRTPRECCDGEDGRPTHFSTLKLWLKTEPEFLLKYNDSWDWCVAHMAREIVSIADDSSKDYVEREGKEDTTKLVFDRHNVARSKLAIESRWRMLATHFPEKFGAATMGGAAPKLVNGDDQKVIEHQNVQDEIKTFTIDQMREEALNWTESKKT